MSTRTRSGLPARKIFLVGNHVIKISSLAWRIGRAVTGYPSAYSCVQRPASRLGEDLNESLALLAWTGKILQKPLLGMNDLTAYERPYDKITSHLPSSHGVILSHARKLSSRKSNTWCKSMFKPRNFGYH
jgi:hypothetical protein